MNNMLAQCTNDTSLGNRHQRTVDHDLADDRLNVGPGRPVTSREHDSLSSALAMAAGFHFPVDRIPISPPARSLGARSGNTDHENRMARLASILDEAIGLFDDDFNELARFSGTSHDASALTLRGRAQARNQ